MANKNKLIEKALKFISKNQYEKAIGVYLEITKIEPSDVRVITKIGDLYLRINNKEEAIKYYIKAGEEYKRKGFETKAAAAYKQVLQLDPNRIDIHFRLAEIYEKTGLVKDSLKHYKNVVKLYEVESRIEKAVDILDRMGKLDPDDYTIKAKLVEALLKAGKKREAEVRIQSVIDGLKSNRKLGLMQLKVECKYWSICYAKPL